MKVLYAERREEKPIGGYNTGRLSPLISTTSSEITETSELAKMLQETLTKIYPDGVDPIYVPGFNETLRLLEEVDLAFLFSKKAVFHDNNPHRRRKNYSRIIKRGERESVPIIGVGKRSNFPKRGEGLVKVVGTETVRSSYYRGNNNPLADILAREGLM